MLAVLVFTLRSGACVYVCVCVYAREEETRFAGNWIHYGRLAEALWREISISISRDSGSLNGRALLHRYRHRVSSLSHIPHHRGCDERPRWAGSVFSNVKRKNDPAVFRGHRCAGSNSRRGSKKATARRAMRRNFIPSFILAERRGLQPKSLSEAKIPPGDNAKGNETTGLIVAASGTLVSRQRRLNLENSRATKSHCTESPQCEPSVRYVDSIPGSFGLWISERPRRIQLRGCQLSSAKSDRR